MTVVKIILKVILTIIRIPFTIWYIIIGACWWLGVVSKILKRDSFANTVNAIITMEFASLTKFYHIKQ